MPWLRIGDNVTTHPKMASLLEATDFDHQKKLTVWAAFVSLATISAAHLLDGVLEMGALAQVAPGMEKEILDLMVAAEWAKREQDANGRWHIVLDLSDPEFVHARTKEEVERERTRRNENRNPEFAIPVRVRDGDKCRWCGHAVNFNDHKSSREGTIDSLTKHEGSTVDTMVVACRGCNSGREQSPDKFKLLPEPKMPWYRDSTIRWINAHPYAVANGIHIDNGQQEISIGTEQQKESKLIGLSSPEEDMPTWAQPSDKQAAAESCTAAGPADQAAPRPQQSSQPAMDSATQEAPDGTEEARLAQAAPHKATPQPAGPRQSEEEPAWMHKSVEELRQEQAAAELCTAAGPADQAAPRPQQSSQPAMDSATQEAPDGTEEARLAQAAPQTEESDTPKSKPYPIPTAGRQTDNRRLPGSGRVGSGRAWSDLIGHGLEGFGSKGRGKRGKRGKRGGKSRG